MIPVPKGRREEGKVVVVSVTATGTTRSTPTDGNFGDKVNNMEEPLLMLVS